MKKLRFHVFVCTNERPASDPRGCCREKGSENLLLLLKEEVKKRGFKEEVRVQRAGCLDQCAMGPVLVVYPEGVWYGRITPLNVTEIVEQHLQGGAPVERLRIDLSSS